jgi:hypothetical protein
VGQQGFVERYGPASADLTCSACYLYLETGLRRPKSVDTIRRKREGKKHTGKGAQENQGRNHREVSFEYCKQKDSKHQVQIAGGETAAAGTTTKYKPTSRPGHSVLTEPIGSVPRFFTKFGS